MRKFALTALPIALIITACGDRGFENKYVFADSVASLCGGTYTGQMISDQPVDADWKDVTLTLGPVQCEKGMEHTTIIMPLAVGDDTSRTWILKPTAEALHFHHQHVELDGSPSAVTNYGGTAQGNGTPTRQEFPADAATIANFNENGLEVSTANVWTLEIMPGQTLTYALSRPNRDFRAQFNISASARK